MITNESPYHLEWVERDGIEGDEPDDSPVTPNTIDMDFLPDVKASSGGSNKAAKTGKQRSKSTSKNMGSPDSLALHLFLS